MENTKMNIPEKNSLKRAVVIGAGFGGLKLCKVLDPKHFQIVLIDKTNYHTFQPLLYQVATAGLTTESIAAPVRDILGSKKNFYFRMAVATRIDAAARTLHTSIGSLEYDVLIVATGAKTNYFGNAAVEEFSLPMKQLPEALQLRSSLFSKFELAVQTTDVEEKKALLTIVIAGGGPTGVELAGAIAELRKHILYKDYPELDISKMKIILVEGSPRLLNGMSDQSGDGVLRFLKEFGVDVKLNSLVKDYDGNKLTLASGEEIITSTLIWAAGVTGNVLDGLKAERGRVPVDNHCEVPGMPGVYAIGDLAYFPTTEFPRGLPGVAPVAMQQAAYIGKCLNKGEFKKGFEYNDKGSMATVGRNRAVLDLGAWKSQGFVAWLIWMFVHLMSLVGMQNRLLVFMNWAWSYVTFDKGSRLIMKSEPSVLSAEANNIK